MSFLKGVWRCFRAGDVGFFGGASACESQREVVGALLYVRLVRQSHALYAGLGGKSLTTEVKSQRHKPPRFFVSPLSSAPASSSPINPLDTVVGAPPEYQVAICSQRQLLAPTLVILEEEPTTSRIVVGILIQWRSEEGTLVAHGDSLLG